MAKDLFNRYIWLVDVIYRTQKITFEEINERWKSHFARSIIGEKPLKRYSTLTSSVTSEVGIITISKMRMTWRKVA